MKNFFLIFIFVILLIACIQHTSARASADESRLAPEFPSQEAPVAGSIPRR
jgi:hypothetical protein